MKHRSRQTRNIRARAAAIAACLSLLFAPPAPAQGDLTGGVGQFAVQPKKPKVVVTAKPKPPAVKVGPKATANDRLLAAAGSGDAATASKLLGQGADANTRSKEGCAALVYAVAAKDPGAAQSLLAKGADANARCTDGVTALMVAAESGDVETMQALVGRGADANAKTEDGRTALMFAASAGQLPVVRALLAKGADVNAHFRDG